MTGVFGSGEDDEGELTDEERELITQRLREVEEGKVIGHEEMKKRLAVNVKDEWVL